MICDFVYNMTFGFYKFDLFFVVWCYKFSTLKIYLQVFLQKKLQKYHIFLFYYLFCKVEFTKSTQNFMN